MRISTKTHGILDFIYSATFLVAPLLLKATNKEEGTQMEDVVLPVIGAGILAQGLMTDHEFGLVKTIPMSSHLKADIGVSALIIAAPWLLNLDKSLRLPMALLGMASLGLTVMTELKPQHSIGRPLNEATMLEEIV